MSGVAGALSGAADLHDEDERFWYLEHAGACEEARGETVAHVYERGVWRGDPAVHPQVESYWGNVNTIGIRSCCYEGKRVAETLAADYIREYDVDVRMVRIFNT